MKPESESSTKDAPRFTLAARMASFGHAFSGIAALLRTEHNAWIHACATLFAVAMGLALQIESGEWLAIVLSIGMVWSAEAMNTAIEALCDLVSPDYDPRVKRAKDVAAAGVLCSAMAALVVALLVFGPRLFS